MTMYREEAIHPEDVDVIRGHGVPANPSPLYVEIHDNGDITITPRGVKLYRLACLLHGLSPEHVSSVTDVESLLALAFKIKRARVIWLNGEIDNGRIGAAIPWRARALVDAVMNGTTEDLHAAMEQRLLCEEAGPNVIPVNFRPRCNGALSK